MLLIEFLGIFLQTSFWGVCRRCRHRPPHLYRRRLELRLCQTLNLPILLNMVTYWNPCAAAAAVAAAAVVVAAAATAEIAVVAVENVVASVAVAAAAVAAAAVAAAAAAAAAAGNHQ